MIEAEAAERERGRLEHAMIRTRRWDDPAEPDDGFRVLVCRYRPRALRKADETWDAWWRQLGPSAELHAAVYGKRGPAISWPTYSRRYLAEMRGPAAQAAVDELARRVADGETITLLCSSACADPRRCHRSLLAELVAERAEVLSRRRA